MISPWSSDAGSGRASNCERIHCCLQQSQAVPFLFNISSEHDNQSNTRESISKSCNVLKIGATKLMSFELFFFSGSEPKCEIIFSSPPSWRRLCWASQHPRTLSAESTVACIAALLTIRSDPPGNRWGCISWGGGRKGEAVHPPWPRQRLCSNKEPRQCLPPLGG